MKQNLDNIRIKPTNRGEFEQIIALFKEAGYATKHIKECSSEGWSFAQYWGTLENRKDIYGFGKEGDNKQYYESFAEYQKSVQSPAIELPERFAVKTPTPELSRRVQQRFFDNGIGWGWNEKQILNTDQGFICLNFYKDDGPTIRSGNTESLVTDRNIPFISIFEFFSRPFPAPAREVKAGDYTFTHKSGEIRVKGPEADNVLIPAEVIKSVKIAIEGQKGKKVFPPAFTVMATKELRDYVVDKVKGNYNQILKGEDDRMNFALNVPNLKAESPAIPIEELHEYSAPIVVTGFSWPIIVAGETVFAGCKRFRAEEIEAALA